MEQQTPLLSVSFLPTKQDYADYQIAACNAAASPGERLFLRAAGFVLVVAGCPPRDTAALTAEEAVEQVLRLVDQGARLKDAAREVAEHTGLSKNELYAAALDRR